MLHVPTFGLIPGLLVKHGYEAIAFDSIAIAEDEASKTAIRRCRGGGDEI